MGYVGRLEGGGYGSVLVASAFDAWYNQGAVISGAANNLPDLRELDLMYAIGPGTKDDVKSLAFTPIKVNMAKLKLNRATIVSPNDAVARGGGLAPLAADTGKTDIQALPNATGFNVSVGGFRSYHPELVFVVLGDASVQKLSESIDPRVLVAKTTFQGGEAFTQ
jgi:hypothetical protein